MEEFGRKGLRVVPLDPVRVMQLYQVREAVDGLAARLAARNDPPPGPPIAPNSTA